MVRSRGHFDTAHSCSINCVLIVRLCRYLLSRATADLGPGWQEASFRLAESHLAAVSHEALQE